MPGVRVCAMIPRLRLHADMLRRRTTSVIKTALFLFLLTFLWLQLHVTNMSGGGGARDGRHLHNDSDSGVMNVPPMYAKFLTPRPKNATNTSSGASDGVAPSVNLTEIRLNVEYFNQNQAILNEDVFGPLKTNSLVIVVQVHTRIHYLRHLIVSLAQAKDIDGALLVVSHDHYDEQLNELVRSVDFCQVIQIFYPYSIQTHPKEFPGESRDDCPRDIKKDQALRKKCVNAAHPDLYGHYREAKFTQTKHHWWWKANRVFDQLEVTRNHTGLVLFLEEDHYVAEDFIPVLQLMDKTRHSSCDKCNILSLGTYLKTYNLYADSKKAEITQWISSKHNMGMAFNRSTWQDIKRCAEFFCNYDDYNWDWSLQHISQVCLKHKLHAMVMKGPRVFHIGECGVHHKKEDCQSNAVLSKVQHVLKNASKYLFPDRLILTYTNNAKKLKVRKGNGGWGDQRDHTLCLNMTVPGR